MDEAIVKQAAERFGACMSDLVPLRGGHSAKVFEWGDAGQRYVLKILPSEYGSQAEAIRSMQSFLAWLASCHVPVVQPVLSRCANLLELIDFEDRRYLVTAAHMVSGIRAETLTAQEWDLDLILRLGQVVGQLHLASQSYTLADGAVRNQAWDEVDNCFNPHGDLLSLDADMLARRQEAVQELASLPRDHADWGLCHLDLHFANFIVEPGTRRITLIDLDESAYGWFAMDIAMLLFDFVVLYGGAQTGPRSAEFLDALLAGYRSIKPLAQSWVAKLPALLKLLEIGVYSMLVKGYDSATCADGWVKTFMRDRERRIRKGVAYLG